MTEIDPPPELAMRLMRLQERAPDSMRGDDELESGYKVWRVAQEVLRAMRSICEDALDEKDERGYIEALAKCWCATMWFRQRSKEESETRDGDD